MLSKTHPKELYVHGSLLGVLLFCTIEMNSNAILIPRLSLQQVHWLCGSKPINTEAQKYVPKVEHYGWNDNITCNFVRPDTVTGQLIDAPGFFIFKPVSLFAEPW